MKNVILRTYISLFKKLYSFINSKEGMSMRKKINRQNEIISILQKRNGATVKELAEIFQVSEMTIRRDLNTLKSNNIVHNVYGATIYNPNQSTNELNNIYNLSSAQTTYDVEKSRIGAYAASLVKEDDIIIIDTGSTTEKLAQNLPNDLKATVLCYNLNILNSLSHHSAINLIFAGGYFHPNTLMFESPQGLSLIRNTRATKVFVSAAGIHQSLGVTCANNYESPTKIAIMASAAEHILLVDSSKFDIVKSSYFSNITDFHKIITDTNLSEEWIDYIHSLNIELVMV